MFSDRILADCDTGILFHETSINLLQIEIGEEAQWLERTVCHATK